MRATLQNIKHWYEANERLLIPGALVLGTTVDYITFRSIDIATALALLIAYFVAVGLVIAFIHLYDARVISNEWKFLRYIYLFSPLAIQFAFGALLSGFFIFYWFSGTISVSWIFILAIVFLMVSNDVLKKYYLRGTVQLAVYYFIAFSLMALVLPFLVGRIGALVFLAAGALSVLFMYGYVRALYAYAPQLERIKSTIAYALLAVFVGMNILYFTNIIPPIPLSLREAGVYHSVERTADGNFRLVDEERKFFERLTLRKTFHITSANPAAYVYSAIFAPRALQASVVHHWRRYDEQSGRWISASKIQFGIAGGRDGGYRGFSRKDNITPGLWRVDIETPRGQVIGRLSFRVEAVTTLPTLQTTIK